MPPKSPLESDTIETITNHVSCILIPHKVPSLSFSVIQDLYHY